MLVWGELDGQSVHRVTISDGAGSEASIVEWGAVLQQLRIQGTDVVLGLNCIEDYIAHSPFFGAIAGRVANRISLGQLELPDRTVQLPTNDGPHHLHGGGPRGVGKRLWTFGECDAHSANLSIVIDEAMDGYPGTATVTARFEFIAPGELQLTMTAEVTEDCPINLAHHSYFNLGDGPTILDHQIQIFAHRYQVTDAALIPIASAEVAGTAYDFRSPRTPHWNGVPLAVDNNYHLDGAGLREIAVVTDPATERTMRVISNQPDVQLYCGHKVSVPVPGLNDASYGPFAGLCLEPQIRPNALRDGLTPTGLLSPGEEYSQVLQLKFEGFA